MTTVSDPTVEVAKLRRSRLDRMVAMDLAATEYQRFAALTADLMADDWAEPTDCPAWNVRQLACHVLGMAELAADPSEGDRQLRLASAERPTDGWAFTDALSAPAGPRTRELAPRADCRRLLCGWSACCPGSSAHSADGPGGTDAAAV